MVWCQAKEGSAAVQDRDEGIWIGTFRDAQIAQQVVQEHNHTVNQTHNESKPISNGGWTSSVSWK